MFDKHYATRILREIAEIKALVKAEINDMKATVLLFITQQANRTENLMAILNDVTAALTALNDKVTALAALPVPPGADPAALDAIVAQITSIGSAIDGVAAKLKPPA